MLDLTKLSDEDLDALSSGDLRRLSDSTLDLLSGGTPKPATPKQSTLSSEFVRGAKQLGSSSLAGIKGIFSPEEAALENSKRQQEINEQAGEGPSLERLKRVTSENGILAGGKEFASQVPKFLAQQAPQLGALATGARLGAMAGTAVAPGVGTVVGGIAGAGLSMLPQFFGQNITRQAEAQKEAGQPIDINRGNAALSAAGQAALEGAGAGFTLGKKVIGRLLGLADDAGIAALRSSRTVAETASQKLLDAAVRGGAHGLAEIPVEVAQAVIERAQAGKDLLSDEALKEYGENAYAAGVVGPTVGAAAKVHERSAAQDQVRQAQQAKDAAEQAEARSARQAADAQEAVAQAEAKRKQESDIAAMSWAQLTQQQEVLKRQEQTPEVKATIDRLQKLKHEIHNREQLARKESDAARAQYNAPASAEVFENAPTDLLGFPKFENRQATPQTQPTEQVGLTPEETAAQGTLDFDAKPDEQAAPAAQAESGAFTRDSIKQLGIPPQARSVYTQLEGLDPSHAEDLEKIRTVLSNYANKTTAFGVADKIAALPWMNVHEELGLETEEVPHTDEDAEWQATVQQELADEQAKQQAPETQQVPEAQQATEETATAEPAPVVEQAPAAPEVDLPQLVSDLQEISRANGNNDIGKRARVYLNEAKQGKTADVAPVAAFVEENKAAPIPEPTVIRMPKSNKRVKKAAPETTKVDKTDEELEAQLADAIYNRNDVLARAIENKIAKRKKAKLTKVDERTLQESDYDDYTPSAKQSEESENNWEQVQESLKDSKTLLDALDVVYNSDGVSAWTKALIDALRRSKSVQSAKFSVAGFAKRTPEGKVQLGGYDGATNNTALFNGGGVQALLHEAVHSAVFGALETDTAFRDSVTALYEVAKQNLPKGDPGLANVQEFVAEAMTDAGFQSELAKIPSTGTIASKLNNVWRKFVDSTRAMLGLPAGSVTLLDDVMHAVIPQMSGEFIPTNKKAAAVSRDDALDLLRRAGRTPAAPPESHLKRAMNTLAGVKDFTPGEATRSFSAFVDKIRTKGVSGNTAFMSKVREELNKQGKSIKEIIGTLIALSDSQAIRSDSLAHEFMLRGAMDFDKELSRYVVSDSENNFKALHGLVADMMEAHGFTSEEADAILGAALEARRISAMDKAGIKFTSHMTRPQVEAANKLFASVPELNDIAKMWDGIRKDVIKVLESTGIYSKEQAEAYLDTAGYVPFYRTAEEAHKAGDMQMVANSLRARREHKFKGSERQVNDIVDNMGKWVVFAVDRAVRNAQATRMVDFSLKEMPEGFITRVRDADKSSVRIMRDGKYEYYDMEDPLFAGAFNGIESFGPAGPKLFRTMANMLRNNVVLMPMFSISQVPQDAFAAIVTSGLSPKYAFRVPDRALTAFIKTLSGKSATYEELKARGVIGADATAAIARIDAEVEAGFRKLSPLQIAANALRKIAMASDSATRQAVYELAQEQGLSRAEALEKAFEIINFRRSGTSGTLRAAAQVIPFFNAYLQALNVTYKVLSGEGISPGDRSAAYKNLATISAMVMMLSAFYTMLNGDDDEYKDMNATTRDRVLHVPGITGFNIPLRTDFTLLPKIIGEYAYHTLTEDGTTDGTKTRKALHEATMNAILGPTPVPQAIKPAFEVAINHDFFTGRDLIGPHEVKKATSEQFTASTSELGKAIGKTGLISPIAADHLIRGWFGSVGGVFTWASNSMLNANEGVSRPDSSAWDLVASMPGMSSVMVKEHGTGLKTDFYDLMKEVDTVVDTFNDIKKTRPQDAKEYIMDEDRLKLYGLRSYTQNINGQLSKIRTAIKQISFAPDKVISPEEKQVRIEKLKAAEDKLLKNSKIHEMRERAGL